METVKMKKGYKGVGMEVPIAKPVCQNHAQGYKPAKADGKATC